MVEQRGLSVILRESTICAKWSRSCSTFRASIPAASSSTAPRSTSRPNWRTPSSCSSSGWSRTSCTSCHRPLRQRVMIHGDRSRLRLGVCQHHRQRPQVFAASERNHHDISIERRGDLVADGLWIVFWISAVDLPHVKQKFYKGSANKPGSGIGLAVSDEIVRCTGASCSSKARRARARPSPSCSPPTAKNSGAPKACARAALVLSRRRLCVLSGNGLSLPDGGFVSCGARAFYSEGRRKPKAVFLNHPFTT